jgi:hypothetical protein
LKKWFRPADMWPWIMCSFFTYVILYLNKSTHLLCSWAKH